jgi:peroxiredoxin (alkyl hydroperoxide reductase subunit C)
MLIVGILLLLLFAGAALLMFQFKNDESVEEEAAFCPDTPLTFNAQLEVGDRAPDFKLEDHKGGFVRLSDYRNQSNVLLVFYPAAWTPVPSEEIPALDADLERFEAEDTQVLGMSADYTASNAAWAESLGVQNMPLLSDYWPHGEVAQAYGVLHPQGFAERATFIVDKEGTIRFKRVYELDELPDSEELFEALQDID